MKLDVNIKGLSKVLKNIKGKEKEILKVAKAALIESALIDIETVAKQKLTKDKHILTGRLRASIHTTFKGKSPYGYLDMQGNAYRSNLNVKKTDMNVFVGTDVVYARKIERLDTYLVYAFLRARRLVPARIKKHLLKVVR